MAYYGQVHYTPAYEARSSSYDIGPRQYENRGPAGSEYNDDLYQYGDEDTDDTYQAFSAYEPKSHASPLNGLIETISAELAKGPTPYGQSTRYKGYGKTLVALWSFAKDTLDARLSEPGIAPVRALEDTAMDHLEDFRALCWDERKAMRELDQAQVAEAFPDTLEEGIRGLEVSDDEEPTELSTMADAEATERTRRRKSAHPKKTTKHEESTAERSSGNRKKPSSRTKDRADPDEGSSRHKHSRRDKAVASSTVDKGKRPHRSRRDDTESNNPTTSSTRSSKAPSRSATSQLPSATLQQALVAEKQAAWDSIKTQLDSTHASLQTSLTELQTWARNNLNIKGYKANYRVADKPPIDPFKYEDRPSKP